MLTKFNSPDPEIVSIWLRQILTQNADVNALIQGRAWDEMSVRFGKFPYVYWSANGDPRVIQVSRSVRRLEWEYHVRGVWTTEDGADANKTRALSKALFRCLCTDERYQETGHTPAECGVVVDTDINQQIGWVWDSSFVRWFRPPVISQPGSNVRIIERGVTIKVTTS